MEAILKLKSNLIVQNKLIILRQVQYIWKQSSVSDVHLYFCVLVVLIDWLPGQAVAEEAWQPRRKQPWQLTFCPRDLYKRMTQFIAYDLCRLESQSQ